MLFLALGIAVFALILCGSVFSHTLQEPYKSNHDDNEIKESFVFPLHGKFGIRKVLKRDALCKLQKSVDLKRENGGIIGHHESKINEKLVSSNAAAVADSSSIFPDGGNIYPDGIKSLYCEELVGQEHSKKQRCSIEEQIMSTSPEKHPSLCEPDHKPEIHKSHEYQYEATQRTTANHVDELAAHTWPRGRNAYYKSGWAFTERSGRMGAMLNASQIQQNIQRSRTCPSQLGSNPRQRKARSWWRQIKKYFCLSCKRN